MSQDKQERNVKGDNMQVLSLELAVSPVGNQALLVVIAINVMFLILS